MQCLQGLQQQLTSCKALQFLRPPQNQHQLMALPLQVNNSIRSLHGLLFPFERYQVKIKIMKRLIALIVCLFFIRELLDMPDHQNP